MKKVLVLFLAVGCCTLAADGRTGAPRCWRKGQLHCHTLWSDGDTLPEVALAKYRTSGFDFVCLSDHDIFPTKRDFDRTVTEQRNVRLTVLQREFYDCAGAVGK